MKIRSRVRSRDCVSDLRKKKTENHGRRILRKKEGLLLGLQTQSVQPTRPYRKSSKK